MSLHQQLTPEQVGNVPSSTFSDWQSDIRAAQDAHIDGFVLNIAAPDPSNDNSIALAFDACVQSGKFSLFFSFDYNPGHAPWTADKVEALLKKYGPNPCYFKHDGKRPFVSTFEGPGYAGDWPAIKAATDAFFVPDWTSISPKEAVALEGGVVDGLFSFDAWPNGDQNITTDGDKVFLEALGEGKVYMMPISPWFYTNLPGYGGKNWLWKGDGLWDARWRQIITGEVKADFVQILTWNDWGESHYIGPVRDKDMELFEAGKAPMNYVKGMSHDGWRKFLPFYIGVYKTGKVPENVGEEGVMAYYRTAPALACPSGGTTGNKAGHGGQVEMPPEQLMEDSVFFAALLNTDKGVTVTVSIGGKEQTGSFSMAPPAGAGAPGVYTGSVPFAERTGDVVVTVSRDGQVIAKADGGKGISAKCENEVQNWNAVAI
jgi:hypothetical protein